MVRVIISLALVLSSTSLYAAISNDPALFLNITNSPRANGMGGCVVTMVTGESPLYNPAALGFLHADKNFSSHIPIATKWQPNLYDDLKLTSWGASLGLHDNYQVDARPSGTHLSYGVAYSGLKMDYGWFVYTDPEGKVLDRVHVYDRADCVSAAMAVNGPIKVGVGATFKFVSSHQAIVGAGAERGSGSASTQTADIGLLVSVPLDRLMARALTDPDDEPSDLNIPLNLSAGFVMSNIFGSLAYFDPVQPDELPRLTRIGVSLSSPITRHNAPILSLQVAGELESGKEQTDFLKMGAEAGVLGTVFVRTGKIDMGSGQPSVKTFGAGFSLNGVVRWLIATGAIHPGDDVMGHAIRSLDLSFDYAKYSGSNSGSLDGTKFVKLQLSF